MNKYYKVMIGILCVAVGTVLICLICLGGEENSVNKQFEEHKEDVINKFLKHKEALSLLEQLYQDTEENFFITADNKKVNIVDGTIKLSQKEKEVLLNLFYTFKCLSIYTQKEEGIKFLVITMEDVRMDKDTLYAPTINYCGEKEKFIKYYGEDLTRFYGKEFEPGWYYAGLPYN